MTIIGIDPGPTQSGVVKYSPDTQEILGAIVEENLEVLLWLERSEKDGTVLLIEKMESRGMPVSQGTLDTNIWVGRFQQIWLKRVTELVKLYTRSDVKLALCGSKRAKSSNIRQAIIDVFGGKDKAIGKKKTPGKLYCIRGKEKEHCWSALALCLTYLEGDY